MDFQELYEKYPSHSRRLKNMERRWKNAEILLDVKASPGVRMLLEELAAKVVAINEKLLNADVIEMPDIRRSALLRERDCWLWLADTFTVAEIDQNMTTKYIEKL